ncbi:MAG: hypothetical protein KC621_08085 [Myxococcales bacterium]|nr:hypothetical protein [Myxococcales bacterium]
MSLVLRHWKALSAAFLVAWAPVLVYWPLGFFLWLPFGLWLLSRRWWLAPLSVVATPAVVIPTSTVGSAVVAYATGTAELHTYGMPDPEFFNLDPTWRMHWRTRGCVIDGRALGHAGPRRRRAPRGQRRGRPLHLASEVAPAVVLADGVHRTPASC